MNKVFLIGNLAKDVELNTTNSGKSVAKFTLATQRRFTNADGERETDFHNIVVWGNSAENCNKYLKKGSKTSVIGEVRYRSYEASDGTKRNVTEIFADEVEFLNTKKNDSDSKKTEVNPELTPTDDDRLPF